MRKSLRMLVASWLLRKEIEALQKLTAEHKDVT
jgi:hypothetical protein